MVGAKYVAAYYVGDMAVYFAYKGARRDFTHWPPMEGWIDPVESFVERLIAKVIVNFTGIIHFRGSAEMGACYWLFDMALALAASPVATRIYFESIRADEEAVMEEGDAWKIVGGLSFGWVVFFVAFMLLIRRKYWSSFFSTQTGYQYVQSKFLREGDENKKAVFKYVRAKRAQIRRMRRFPALPPPPPRRTSPALTLPLRSQVQQEDVAVDPGRREGVDVGELGALGGGEGGVV
jgi:hypothetical protein